MIKHYDKVVILTKEDTYISLEQWQQRYEPEVHSDQIGKYFRFTEGKFLADIERYGKLIVCEPLMLIMDEYRKLKGEPVKVNAYNRDDKKQQELHEQGFRTAQFSPHVEKMAVDMDTLSIQDTYTQLPILRKACWNLGFGYRIGWKQYLENVDKDGKPAPQTFLHLDVAPHYYASGKARHEEKHPSAWEINKLEW